MAQQGQSRPGGGMGGMQSYAPPQRPQQPMGGGMTPMPSSGLRALAPQQIAPAGMPQAKFDRQMARTGRQDVRQQQRQQQSALGNVSGLAAGFGGGQQPQPQLQDMMLRAQQPPPQQQQPIDIWRQNPIQQQPQPRPMPQGGQQQMWQPGQMPQQMQQGPLSGMFSRSPQFGWQGGGLGQQSPPMQARPMQMQPQMDPALLAQLQASGKMF
jgi:hypothetical protein